MASLLLAVIYLAFVSLGLPDSLLGAGWPAMHSYFGVPLSLGGTVSMIITGGTIVSSLLSERLTRRLGTARITLISVLLTALALLGFSLSRRFLILCLWAVPYGLGAGAIDAALNNYVALHYSARDMSWLHCFWGVGTIISPYIMSLALARGAWQLGYRTVSCLQLGIFLVLLFTLPLWKVHQPLSEAKDPSPPLGIGGALKTRGVAPLLLGFFSYCALESTAMLWTASYLRFFRNIPEERAAACAALFFIGITLGRFLAGFLSGRLGDLGMIRLGTAILFLGIALVALTFLPKRVALVGFVIIGLGCAPIYPSIIHATPHTFGAKNAQAIIGLQMASAYLGSTVAPPLFGLLSGLIGLAILPFYLALFAAAMILLLRRAFFQAQT